MICLIKYIDDNNINECINIINEKINFKNIDLYLDEYLDYYDNYKDNDDYIFILNYLNDLKKEFLEEELFITESIDKDFFTKRISDDLIINLTGESGSGKSTMCSELISLDSIIVDTDKVFGGNVSDDPVSQKLYNYMIDNYGRVPNLIDEFDLCYECILDCFHDRSKLLIIDSAQFRNMKDLSKLRGEVIVLRTCIDTCYNRCISRYESKNNNLTLDDKINYMNKKKNIYKWYHKLNEFIYRVYEL